LKLTQEKKDKLIQHFDKFWTNQKCEICGHEDWTIDESLFEMREFHGATTILGKGFVKPLVTVSCQNCKNTKFFNAVNLGLIDLEDK